MTSAPDRSSSGSTGEAAHWCSRCCLAATGSRRRRSRHRDLGRRGELCVAGHLDAAVPRQRLGQAGGQLLEGADQRVITLPLVASGSGRTSR